MTDRIFASAAFLLVLGALLLNGCAGGSPAAGQRYLLAIHQAPDPPLEPTARQLDIAPLRLAPFLQTDGIVMQTGAVTIHQGRDHLWAENLATQLQRSLCQELARKLRRVQVLAAREPAPPGGALRRLEVEVDGFHGRYDGVAVVAGQWWLRDDAGRLLDSRQFSIERPLAADGYQALVESLAVAWRGVADAIAPAVAASW